MNATSRNGLGGLFVVAAGAVLLALGCATGGGDAMAHPAATAASGAPMASTTAASCDNDALTAFDALLVVTPHPDDEVLGFAGLISAYLKQDKPVSVVVTTDGDAYCEACRFWKSNSVRAATCDAADLSNFATPEIDSFAEVRRSESSEALGKLGAPAPTFLGYPDTGLAAAWANYQSGDLDKPLRRSDFSRCDSCETCDGGYGEGPVTELSAQTLVDSLRERLAATPRNTLVATTHWLDGHGDHAGLGHFVQTLNAELPSPRAIAFGVIHANTPKNAAHSDCWYPAPEATVCPCADQDRATADPQWIAALRRHRFLPEGESHLPDDVDYGPETRLCLPPALYRGDAATKLAAVSSYRSQLGFAARHGEMPPALAGIMDCNGYLISFVRSTEAFVLVRPGEAGP
jgi:LmbE family N-acetylglucosaminyl deacetylase